MTGQSISGQWAPPPLSSSFHVMRVSEVDFKLIQLRLMVLIMY